MRENNTICLLSGYLTFGLRRHHQRLPLLFLDGTRRSQSSGSSSSVISQRPIWPPGNSTIWHLLRLVRICEIFSSNSTIPSPHFSSMQLTTMRHTLNLPSSEVWIVRYEIIPARTSYLYIHPTNTKLL